MGGGMGGGVYYNPYNTFHSFDTHVPRSLPYPFYSPLGGFHPHVHHPNAGSTLPPSSPPRGGGGIPLHHAMSRTYSNASLRSGGSSGGSGVGGGSGVVGMGGGIIDKEADLGSTGSGERTPKDWHSQ